MYVYIYIYILLLRLKLPFLLSRAAYVVNSQNTIPWLYLMQIGEQKMSTPFALRSLTGFLFVVFPGVPRPRSGAASTRLAAAPAFIRKRLSGHGRGRGCGVGFDLARPQKWNGRAFATASGLLLLGAKSCFFLFSKF